MLLEEAQLADEVELEAEPGRIVIRRGNRPRAGWAAAVRKMRERNKDRLLDPTTPTRFDEKRVEVAVDTQWQHGARLLWAIRTGPPAGSDQCVKLIEADPT